MPGVAQMDALNKATAFQFQQYPEPVNGDPCCQLLLSPGKQFGDSKTEKQAKLEI